MKKIPKKFLATILSAVIVLSIFANVPITANAAGNSISSATYYSIGSTVNGSITDSNDKDFYKFTLASSGRITINLNAYICKTNYSIYDTNGDEVWYKNYQYWNDTTKKIHHE